MLPGRPTDRQTASVPPPPSPSGPAPALASPAPSRCSVPGPPGTRCRRRPPVPGRDAAGKAERLPPPLPVPPPTPGPAGAGKRRGRDGGRPRSRFPARFRRQLLRAAPETHVPAGPWLGGGSCCPCAGSRELGGCVCPDRCASMETPPSREPPASPPSAVPGGLGWARWVGKRDRAPFWAVLSRVSKRGLDAAPALWSCSAGVGGSHGPPGAGAARPSGRAEERGAGGALGSPALPRTVWGSP